MVAWKATAEMAAKFFTKGRMAAVKGRLQLRDWTDKNGVKRRTAEIIADTVFFADRRPDAAARGGVDVPGEFVELDEDEAEADGDLPF